MHAQGGLATIRFMFNPGRPVTGAFVGKLINIDNGGTLTDVVIIDDDRIHRTKTLTTPYDLSKCFFDGLKKASLEIFGREDVAELLRTTDYIRYSTTQGTNALVERKGPRLGLVLAAGDDPSRLAAEDGSREMLAALVGERVAHIDLAAAGEDYDAEVIRVVNVLAALGANRLVVGLTGAGHVEAERRMRAVVLRKFPPHLLGAVPVLFSHEIAGDADDARRTWSALLNAFLHPAMETFLYHAEHKLREARFRTPLLIFRNDGDSARVAKTIALKTYSSGPRGGMEGARALAAHYGVAHLVSVDVGGTTTDIGVVREGLASTQRRGRIENVVVSFPLVDITSIGVGGGSVIRANGPGIRVGPESVGAQPGPACFGLGGKQATITDVFVLMGVLDPESFFGGELRLDVERARAAVQACVAEPLDMSLGRALEAMEGAWVERIADGIRRVCEITPETTLAAFGGGGPLDICVVAEALGVERAIVPRLAAVFSAYGLSFSDIAHHYEMVLPENSDAALAAALAELRDRAARDMFTEGFDLSECEQTLALVRIRNGLETPVVAFDGTLPVDLTGDERCKLDLSVTRRIRHAELAAAAAPVAHAARTAGQRVLRQGDGSEIAVPLVRLDDNRPGAGGDGPAIIEESFFTCRVPAGWGYRFTASGDLMLEKRRPA